MKINENNENNIESANFINISISKYKQTIINDVEFTLQLFSDISNKHWKLQRNLSDLYNYHKYLIINFSFLPIFPEINFSLLNLEKTKILLELYLNEILNRNDVINNPQTEKFFELKNNHFSDYYLYQPKLITFSQINSQQLIFFKNNYYLSTFKKEIRIIKYENKIFQEIYQKNIEFEINIIKIKTFKKINFILLSLSNGSIEIYNLNILNESKIFFEKMNNIKIDNKTLFNFDFNEENGYLYSVNQNDNKIIISEINYEKIISKIILNEIKNSYISGFEYNKKEELIFVCDFNNFFYIYQIKNLISLNLIQSFNENILKGKISVFKFDEKNSFLLIGTNESEALIYYYDLKKNVIYKIENIICDKLNKKKIIDLNFNHIKNEFIICLSNGKILFFYNSKNIPEFVLDCCNFHKYNIIFDENNFHLLTNCNENEFKLWKIPKKWTGEIIKKNKLKSFDSIFIFQNNKKKSEENKENINNVLEIDEDEYNSSLDGWDEEITKEESTKKAINNFFSL